MNEKADQSIREGARLDLRLDLRVLRWSLAAVWIATGAVVLGIYPREGSLALLARAGLGGNLALLALFGGALLDLGFGCLTLWWPRRWLWRAQAAVIVVYSAIITVALPEFWIHPFGPLLKNLPILAIIWLLHQQEGGRR
ncbi:MAG: DoxX-like family protein [Pseudomonadota bacterium]